MKKWFGRPLRFWLWAITGLALISVGLGVIFVRRDVVEYRMGHTLAVNDPAFFGYALALSDPLPLEKNKIDLLENGDQIFPAMLTAIRAAQHSIHFEAYLFESGQVGAQFEEALSERARAGVKVRILLDGVGSSLHLKNQEVEALKQAGCAFAYYHPTRAWRLDRLNQRSHRRILVVDGKIGFTGGVGFADRWQGNADAQEHWRDTHARLEGPIVTKLQSAFLQHWAQETGDGFGPEGTFPNQAPAGKIKAQIITSRAFSLAPMAWAKSVAFSSATRSILITNAYCAPSTSQVEQLVEAVRRGVDVRLLLPGKHNDQPMTKAAGRSAYGDLLKGGVKIFEYEPSMIHAKTIIVDGLFATLGSSNFDARSAQINEEIDLTVWDAEFGHKLEQAFERDLSRAKPYTLKEFQRRSWFERLTEWAVLPFHSQL